MLVLTCRIGGSLRIGDDILVTLPERRGSQIAVGLLAPSALRVYLDSACLQPLVLPSGTCSYLFSLVGVRRFRVGLIEVGVWLPGQEVPEAALCDDFVHVGVIGPGPLRIGYEQADDGLRPSVTCLRAPLSLVMH